jgi:hypothetical protein
MAIYTVNDPDTKFATKAMVACGGAWNPVRKVWMFASIANAADAALELYRVTRATIPMLEELRSMLADGTAVAAWEYDETQPLDLEALSFGEAKAMVAAGRQVRRLLGVHPLEDVSSRDEVVSPQDEATSELCEQQFEQRAQHSRGREPRGSGAEYSPSEFRCSKCGEVRDVTTLRKSVCGECRNKPGSRSGRRAA